MTTARTPRAQRNPATHQRQEVKGGEEEASAGGRRTKGVKLVKDSQESHCLRQVTQPKMKRKACASRASRMMGTKKTEKKRKEDMKVQQSTSVDMQMPWAASAAACALPLAHGNLKALAE